MNNEDWPGKQELSSELIKKVTLENGQTLWVVSHHSDKKFPSNMDDLKNLSKDVPQDLVKKVLTACFLVAKRTELGRLLIIQQIICSNKFP